MNKNSLLVCIALLLVVGSAFLLRRGSEDEPRIAEATAAAPEEEAAEPGALLQPPATANNAASERVPLGPEPAPIDDAYRISDEEALPILYDLLQHEGLCLGGSSAINVAGAIRLAKELGPGHTVVTVLCDSGTRYQSKLYNPEFLRGKNLPVPAWLS